MDFKVKINNIGKLKNAAITVRPLTILAGPNNTGKTFFSKTLYSVFNAMNSDLIGEHIFHRCVRPVYRTLRVLEFWFQYAEKSNKIKNTNMTDLIKSKKTNLEEIMKKVDFIIKKIDAPFSPSTNTSEIGKILDSLITQYKELIPLCEKLKLNKLFDTDILKQINKNISDLEEIKKTEPEMLQIKGLIHCVKENLTRNFQTSDLQKLTRDNTQPATINIENICAMTIDQNNIQTLEPSTKGLNVLRDCSRVIYLESPFFWKLRDALSSVRRNPVWRASSRKSLLVPRYFSDLSTMLLDKLSGDIAFPNILDNIKTAINGQIIIDEGGSLQFKESKGNSHALHITATGVTQLGMLALLIEKKILDKGTVLFIDEPETNLHPAWQVEMIAVLFKLIKEGVHVIMATHSADILKWLEVYLGKNPDDTQLVALNEMALNEDGEAFVINSSDNIQEKVATIKENLTKPFLDLFLKEQE